ncbi:MAG: hypothetical protein D9V44_06245 [Actinobacteria bacterium]|nr:MAG: hypothetical protein D9V44_06245 [Actinomycetota bacterium]
MTHGAPNAREHYLRWMRASSPALLAPFALIGISQLLAATGAPAFAAPLGLRSMMLAAAVGAVLFGRTFGRRITLAPSGMPTENAIAFVRSTSWTLVGLAASPSVLGIVLVLFTHSPGDALLMLVLTLLGFVLLYPSAVQWDAWLRHLVAPAEEVGV